MAGSAVFTAIEIGLFIIVPSTGFTRVFEGAQIILIEDELNVPLTA
jgi:hypothetical protein